MSKEREFFQRIVDWYDDDAENVGKFVEEIRAYLAKPRLTDEQKEALAKELCFHNHGDRLEQYAEQVLTSCIRCGGSGCEQDSKPEVKREALSIEEAHSYYSESHYDKTGWVFFLRGVRFAEKHHGIGGGDE